MIRTERLILLGLTGALSIGCGSESAQSGASEGASASDGGEPGLADCDPEGEVPCFEEVAEPCGGISSGYDGDEYCRAVPDPSVGFQIHVGPSDYSNPDEVEKYLAYPGDETNWAEIVETPNDTTMYWDGYYSFMRPGSHHFILYGMPPGSAPPASGGPMTNGDGAESAVGAVGGTFLAGATVAVQNAMTHDPDSAGSATEVAPHSQYAVNLHFINSADEPLIQEIWVNFHQIAESDILHWKRAITWYGGFGMDVPPATEYKLDSGPTCVPPAGVANMQIQGVTGHVHANTVEYSASMHRDGQTTLLFQDFDWHDATEFRYNSVDDNGTPDPVTKQAGGYNGVLKVQPTDVFSWECTGYNKSDVNLRFSNKVYDGEMCNVFGFYQTDTKDAAPWTCAFF